MADLAEDGSWPSGIFQLETNTPVLGGPPNLGAGQGMSNVPLQQLANRTKFLRDLVDAMGLGATTGPAITDFNAVTRTGFYTAPSTAANAPEGSTAFQLLHVAGASTAQATQIAMRAGTVDRLWYRRREAGAWAAWVQIALASALGSITAGAGLTGGGNLPGTLTLNVGAGDGISVAADSVGVDGSVVRTSRSLVAGNGLTGGGSLGADRVFNVNAGDGIDVTADAVAVDATVVRTGRTIVAGNGLAGGGTLGADRTLTLGTPSAITATSGNDVTATSHTHALTPATVRALLADTPLGSVGSYAYLRRSAGASIDKGTNYAGSNLRYSGSSSRDGEYDVELEDADNSAPPGTWQAMGSIRGVSPRYTSTLFLRVA